MNTHQILNYLTRQRNRFVVITAESSVIDLCLKITGVINDITSYMSTRLVTARVRLGRASINKILFCSKLFNYDNSMQINQ